MRHLVSRKAGSVEEAFSTVGEVADDRLFTFMFGQEGAILVVRRQVRHFVASQSSGIDKPLAAVWVRTDYEFVLLVHMGQGHGELARSQVLSPVGLQLGASVEGRGAILKVTQEGFQSTRKRESIRSQ